MKLKFQIKDDGYLYVSYDDGCSWESIGLVKGDASTEAGPQGPEGPAGAPGTNGQDGEDGSTPVIGNNGNWWIDGEDTGIPAVGKDGTISIEASTDIADNGTPSVTSRLVNGELLVQFHQLKGDSGIAPEVTAERVGDIVTIYVNGDEACSFSVDSNYTAGENITITNKVIDAKIPKTEHELIYYKQSEEANGYGGFFTQQLMYIEGLVVDTPDDFALCKQGADISMSKVISDWAAYGYSQDDRNNWGYCDSSATGATQTVTKVGGATQVVPVYKYNNTPQKYIFNTKNTDYITGYYSNGDSFTDFDSIVALGIIPSLKQQGATDYMAIIPALYSGSDCFCGLSISVNNTYNTNQDGREMVNSSHTISVIAWTQATPNTQVSSPIGATQLLTNAEGVSIIPYNASLCNGTSSGTASCIQVKVRRRGNVITFWASEAYPTTDDDYQHTADIHLDRPITINLDTYKLTYVDASGVSHEKDCAGSSAILNKLKGSAMRGYEACSNPGSIFRTCNADELILDVTPGEDKVWKYDDSAGTWVTVNTTPQALVNTGSRIAWNRITDKLFYNDGASIYRISTSGGTANDGKLTIQAESQAVTEFTANSAANKLINVLAGIGVTVTPNATAGTITISTESNHEIISMNKVIQAGDGSKGEILYDYSVRCDLNGSTVKVAPFYQFGTDLFSECATPNNSAKWEKTENTIRYIGLFGASSASNKGVLKLTIKNSTTGSIEIHYIGYIEDTYQSGTQGDGTFCFITTCGWNFICKGATNNLYCYIEVPANFIGTIECQPIIVDNISTKPGLYFFGANTDESNIEIYSWWNSANAQKTLTTMPSTYKGGDLPTGGVMNTPVGRYNVDILYDFKYTLNIGDKISDSLINDCILHQLSKKIDSLLP